MTSSRWLPVVGGVMLNLALGSLYAWSVFVLPLEREFGWDRSQTSWVFTIAIVVFALTFIAAGRLQDTYGPRPIVLVGGTLLGLGFALASFTTSLLFLYIAFGVVVGLGNGFGYAAPVPVASKWFPDKRGLVVGLMVGGYGAGSAILGPLAASLIEAQGWRFTFRLLGVVFFVMAMIGAALLKNPPVGYTPPGWKPSAAMTARRDVPTAEVVRTPTFYLLWIAYCLGTTSGLMVISQLVPFGTNAGLSAAAATFALTIGAVGNAGGRILSGWLSDSIGRLTTLRIMIVVSALAMPALFLGRQNVAVFYLLVAAVYWCYGTQLSLFASTTADFYGTKYLGLNYGLLFTAWGVAGILGPFIAGRAFSRFNDYGSAFYIAAGLSVVAFGALAVTRNPRAGVTPLAQVATKGA